MRAPTLHERSSSLAAHDVRFHQHSRFQPCGDARGHRRARLADRASPHAAAHADPLAHPPRLDARRDVAPIACRRRPRHQVAVNGDDDARDSCPPRSPGAADPHFAHRSRSRSSGRRRANSGVVRLRATRPKRNRFADAIRPASTSPASSPSPCTSFGVTPTTMCSPSDCTSDTPTVDVVSACTLRNTSSRLSGLIPAGSTAGIP